YWNNHTLQILRPSISRTTCQIKGLQIVQGGLPTSADDDGPAGDHGVAAAAGSLFVPNPGMMGIAVDLLP
ncbi:hypothetical protein, partial [Paracidovorax valerianellae]|uniref:hypothetical protein n=1 Tax=Paracidovorax valerianellae TaxID=187868 RepID=UPI002303E30E